MKIKFKNGKEKECSNPIEQKLFKNGEAVGWVCSFSFKENTPSAEVDEVLTKENIAELVFLSNAGEVLFSLAGYTGVTSVIVRHAETDGSAEIQLTKGV